MLCERVPNNISRLPSGLQQYMLGQHDNTVQWLCRAWQCGSSLGLLLLLDQRLAPEPNILLLQGGHLRLQPRLPLGCLLQLLRCGRRCCAAGRLHVPRFPVPFCPNGVDV